MTDRRRPASISEAKKAQSRAQVGWFTQWSRQHRVD
ncbi:hypothetical protein ACTIVE_6237 [Actinomadura verrucosospora]|uniref:Uncharacterized protein n=1 Tax=Actinomadura verrucosospora TaxID=46165 RepID=A0A7D3VX01_ACTVE|nr:hypothetical protein ACTIVE_6237 [Actinomadura verrucosospora]